jgi:hypothetical protein
MREIKGFMNSRILDRRKMIEALGKCWISLAQPDEVVPRWASCPVPCGQIFLV